VHNGTPAGPTGHWDACRINMAVHARHLGHRSLVVSIAAHVSARNRLAVFPFSCYHNPRRSVGDISIFTYKIDEEKPSGYYSSYYCSSHETSA
jgi:hypothetical protein